MRNAQVLDLAVLGLLAETAMHGYQLRERLRGTLGTLRAFSFGSLYPALRRLSEAGWIAADKPPRDVDTVALSSRRSRVTYRITDAGRDHLADLLGDGGPDAWSDDGFGVHLAFFARTSPETRLRILEGRRRRVEERRERLRTAMARAGERLDRYTAELHQLGLDASDREVSWLDTLIDTERRAPRPAAGPMPDITP